MISYFTRFSKSRNRRFQFTCPVKVKISIWDSSCPSSHLTATSCLFEYKGVVRTIHLSNTRQRLILQRCRLFRHRSLILGRSIFIIIFSKPNSLFPTELFAFSKMKNGREKIVLVSFIKRFNFELNKILFIITRHSFKNYIIYLLLCTGKGGQVEPKAKLNN